MIHINQVRAVLRAHKPFGCRVWKKNGEIMECPNVVCTSTFHENDTANLKFIPSGQVRTVPVICIFEVNDEEVYI